MPSVITGQELKDIRARARLTNQQLAELFEMSLSTVNRMLAHGVRPEDEPMVRERLAQWLPPSGLDHYAQMSDAALLAEMNRLLGVLGQRLAEKNLHPLGGSVGIAQVSSERDRNHGTEEPRPRAAEGRGPRARRNQGDDDVPGDKND